MSTTTALPPEALTRLLKLLGMLGSDHVGERAAAGLKAQELLKSHGLQWQDVVGGEITLAELQAAVQKAYEHGRKMGYAQRRQQQRRAPAAPRVPKWAMVARACLERHDEMASGFMSSWEHGFISDILERDCDGLSAKQWVIVQRIAAKLGIDVDAFADGGE